LGNKLNLDQTKIDGARQAAGKIADQLHAWINDYTTTTIERAVARLLGVDGVDDFGVPLPNVLVDKLHQAGLLDRGFAPWLARAILDTGKTVQEIADAVGKGELDVQGITDYADAQWIEAADRIAMAAASRICSRREERTRLMDQAAPMKKPLLYVIVATGNIYEDAVQAKVAALQGADVIAVIRHTGQSLLDYVPFGPTTEGYGGTYATQENFRIVREALDQAGAQSGRYIQLVNYCSGLCMPEIAAMGACERLALRSGLREEQIGLGHAFEIDPKMEDGLLMEIAQAQLSREIFPRSPLKYMPPTKHVTGDIFHTYLVNGMFNLTSILTGQEIQLLGMLTEASHTPYLQDRYLSIANAHYIFNNARRIGEELIFREEGRIQERANKILNQAGAMLLEIEKIGLEVALARGMFADIKRSPDGGKGKEGVVARHSAYYNPFPAIFLRGFAPKEGRAVECKLI